jgi:hypothetical protein
MDANEFITDIDSVEGAVLGGAVISASAWARVAGDVREWLIRMNGPHQFGP